MTMYAIIFLLLRYGACHLQNYEDMVIADTTKCHEDGMVVGCSKN